MGGQTLVEKLAALHRAGGPDRPLRAGDMVSLRPRHLLTHDNSAAIIRRFAQTGAGRVRYPWQALIALDHDVQNTDPARLAVWQEIAEFARRQRIEFRNCGSGVGHQIMVEGGYVVPWSLCVASDSHANLYGALGALGTPVVRTDAAAIWATGEFWWQVPHAVEVRLEGELPAGATGKDLILSLCRHFHSGEVHDAAIEFTGPGVRSLTMDDRFAVANMTTEWGAIAGIFPVDSVTIDSLEGVRRELAKQGRRRFSKQQLARWSEEPLAADPDAAHAARITVDLASVRPAVNGPASPLTAAPATGPLDVDKAYLVGCANARLSDLRAAARIVRGRKVHPRVRFYVAAASRRVQDEAVREGIWADLVESGARTLPPGCAMCIGLGEGLVGPGEVAVSATNRNYPGRMGAADAQVWLASPAAVAEAALSGRIDPSAGAAPLDARYEPAPAHAVEGVAEGVVTGFPARMQGRAIWMTADDLDTDQIYPSRAVYEERDAAAMRELVFEHVEDRFAEKVAGATVLVGGFNFGCGSSREQAVTALAAAGFELLVAGSFARTFLRNAINQGVVCVESPELVRWLRGAGLAGDRRWVELGDRLEIDFANRRARIGGQEFACGGLPVLAQELCLEGGIVERVRRRFTREIGS